ncbi:MAG TPA: isochorismatase family protein, partial [Zoogloea sp.]|nr:isochorismatase family protein [Zoogloea sp.]
DLDARLKALGVKNLVVVGFMTHMCINSTGRGAFNLGYAVTVPANATATRPLAGLDGSTVPAAALQAAALAALGDLFAVVVPDVADIPD